MISPGHHVFPASFPQRQLWLVEQTEEPGATYNVPFGLRLRGDLNREALDASFRYLTARHEVLRTTFAMQGQELCQIIRPEAAVVVRSGELDDGAEPVEAKLGRQLEREALARFDLEAGPLVRAALFRLGPLDHALVVTMHHIIADAWSVDVFLEELASAYDCLVQGREPELPPLPIQYADFAAWQVEAATADHLAPALGYWRKQLAASLPELQLPTDRPRPAEQRHRGGQVRVVIPEQLTAPLRALATEAGATLFMALFASFQVLLYRHTGQTDIITGTPIAGRHRPEATGLIGFFLNMLAIRTDLSGNPSFPELLAQVRRTLLDAYAAQDLPFEQLVEALQVARERSRHPVFQTVFVLLGSEHAVPSFRGLTVQPLAVPPGAHSKFDLQLAVTDTGKGLQVEFEYDSDLFDVATIEAMAERYRVLLGSLSASSTPIAHLPVLTAAETTRLLDTWNATTTDYPRDRSLSELFEQQVDVSPGAVALLEVSEAEGGPPRVHSYLELDRAANRLAHHLCRHGVIPGSRVGILLGRSTDCVLAILAALKAGACYVPIDPTLPNDRRKLFLEEAGVTTLVTTSSLIRARPGQNLRIISLDEAGAAIAGESEARLGAIPGGDAPAYLTFTAPMSDHPLAVLMPHRALVRMVRNTNFCTLTGTDVILGSSPVWGNGWVFEIWGSLLNGGRLVLHRAGPPASGEIARVIRDYGVTTLYLTASQLHPTTVAQPESLSGLRRLIVAGGVLPPTLARQALTHLGSGELIYAYGPVESTGIACYHRLSEDETPGGALPIGHPVSNTRVYVLDRGLQPVPVGVRGELWIGGDGLSVGYLNDARLTAQRFLPDRFSNDRSRHMFGTGDIVRYRPDGTLELFGPAETEITIRGFRVDPTKVERLLSTYPGVESAAVIARERDSGEKWLLAYFTPHKGAALKIPEVRAFLRGHLPEYAIPSAFVTLPTIPRQANGTIDHRSLPEPAAEDPQSGGASDGLQTQLRVVWEQVLGVSDIGVHDNFFELGGNSFRAINMVSILEKSIRRKVPIATLYRGQTIASMALALREEAVDLSLRAVAIQPGGARPPLFVVPGVSGDVVGYEALARALGPEQPVYVLRSVGLDGEAPPLEDIQSIGASLVSEVRRVQPRGPYNLAGFCMGGIVAYEMAQQLVSQGNQTGLVALVDTNAPEVLPVRTRRSRLAVQWAFLVRGVSRHVHAMLEQPRGQRLRYILRKSRIVTEMLQQGDIYRGDTHPLYAELVSSANLSAAASYRPLPFPGKLRLILSTEGDPQIPGRDPRLSWGELARDGSATTRVQGKDSGSLLKPPNVLSLAEVLTRELDSPGGEAGDN